MIWWQYLILANVYLILFYGFYTLLLRRETFFQLNRFYLVGSAMLSFLVPLIQADWARNLFITQQIKQSIYHLDPIAIYQTPAAPSQHLTVGQILAIIYAAGIVFLASRFLLQLWVLKYSIKYGDSDDAYSFFKTIKLGEKLADRDVIMAHEEVHAQQWHSADVLLIEAIMILNWFNPAVYFYRKSIKHIHEFIADRNALKTGTSKQEYALLLLSETFKTPAHQLVNPFFNHSLLKQRILMLQKNNSQRTALLKYGLSAPLFALMLVLSSATVSTNRVINIINDKAEEVMLAPATTPTLRTVYTAISTTPGKIASTYYYATKPEVKDFEPSNKPVAVITGTSNANASDVVFTTVEKLPEFKGGVKAFGLYLKKNIRYPEELRKLTGHNRAFVSFIVEKDGSLSHVKSANNKNTPADIEAIRVIKASPRWIPGVQNGRKVRVQFTVPIDFTLAGQAVTTAIVDSVKKDNNVTGMQTFNSVVNVRTANTDVKHTYTFVQTVTTKFDSTSNPMARVSYIPRTQFTVPGTNSPVFYIDGKEASKDELRILQPNDINSINVIKGQNGIDLYGSKAVNGVIMITTKKISN